MRRLAALALITAFATLTTNAHAQTKKKKPKKPKTEQREPEPEPSTIHSSGSDPAPIDTTLKEVDTPPPRRPPSSSEGEHRENDRDHAPESRKKDDDPWLSRPLAVTAQVGYASANLRIGLGARVGYSINDKIYVGGAFMYHLGTTFDDTTYSGFYPSAEGGYDVHIQGFTIRPYGGLGVFVSSLRGGSVSESSTALAIYPGVQFDYQFGRGFVGADLRALFVLESGRDTSIGFFLVGGARF